MSPKQKATDYVDPDFLYILRSSLLILQIEHRKDLVYHY